MLRFSSTLSIYTFLKGIIEAFLVCIIRDYFRNNLQIDAEHCKVSAAVKHKPFALPA